MLNNSRQNSKQKSNPIFEEKNPIFEASSIVIEDTLSEKYDIPRNDNLYNLKSLLQEFNSIKISGPRRSGHTTAIPQIIGKFFKNNVVILSMHQRSCQSIQNILKSYYIGYVKESNHSSTTLKNNSKIFTFSMHSLNNISRLENLDAIIIDTACMMSPKLREELIKTSLPYISINKKFLLIFIE